VSQRKAPGAINAIALTVKPVKPSVALVVEGEPPDPDVLLIGFVSTFGIMCLLLGGSLVMVWFLSFPCAWRSCGLRLAFRSLIAESNHARTPRFPPRLTPCVQPSGARFRLYPFYPGAEQESFSTGNATVHFELCKQFKENELYFYHGSSVYGEFMTVEL
jgi:hypothetical protein